MNRLLFLLFFIVFATANAASQAIIKNIVYKSNFSNTFHAPRYVSYTLYLEELSVSQLEAKLDTQIILLK